MNHTDIELIERRVAYQGYFRIEAYRLRHRLFAGGWSHELSRELFDRGRVAGVLLYDPDRDAVILVEQFRIGALASGRPPWVVEIVAGIIEAGEEAADVARRETHEEAGCVIGELIPLYDYLVSPGCTSERVALFCGRVDSANIGGIHGSVQEHEDIRVSVVGVDDALRALDDGRIANSLTIIALQWLALNRDGLRRRWSNERNVGA
jgi:ADP-ribose pyrophosphatase